jgi:hypothetical protein
MMGHKTYWLSVPSLSFSFKLLILINLNVYLANINNLRVVLGWSVLHTVCVKRKKKSKYIHEFNSY